MYHQTLARRLVWEASFSTCRERKIKRGLLKGSSFICMISLEIVRAPAAPKISPPKEIPASLHTPNIAHHCLQHLRCLRGTQERNEEPKDSWCLFSLRNERAIPKHGCSPSASEIPHSSEAWLCACGALSRACPNPSGASQNPALPSTCSQTAPTSLCFSQP